jgi:DNA-binding SARP family transcriptional activator
MSAATRAGDCYKIDGRALPAEPGRHPRQLCDDRPVEHVDVTLLGRFEVRVDGQSVAPDAWKQGRARDLVKILALAPGHRLPRERALDDLWPQLEPGAAMSNLHKAAHHARRALGDQGGVVLREGLVVLAPEARIETDVERFEASPDPDRYGGELLPDDSYAPWAEERRRALHAQYLDALRGAGRWEALAAADPADERAGVAVMRERFAAGDRAGALRAFDRLAAGLADLGLEPGIETLSLHARISGGAALQKALAAVELELRKAPVAERASLLATRADLLMSIADRGAPAAYAEAAAAAGPEGMALRIRQAWAQLAGGDPGAARATLAQLEPGSEGERVAHLLAEAAAAWFSGNAADAGRLAAEAQPRAEALGLAREARMAVQIQAMVAHSTGNWSASVDQSLDASLLAPDVADTLFDGHLCVGEYVLTCGEPLDRIRQAAERLYANAVRSGARRVHVFAATLLGEIALITGLVDQADARLREATQLSREIGAVSAEALASLRLGEAARARGELAEADRLLGDALIIARWSPMSGHLMPLGYAALLRATDAPALGLERLADGGAYLREQQRVCAYCGMAFHVAAAIAAARAEQLDQAAMALARAEATVRLWRGGGPWPAALDEARGEIARAGGDTVEARARLTAAAEAFARGGRTLDSGRVQARLAGLD